MSKEKIQSLSISFLGPDGSGKSTLIDELMSRELGFKSYDYFHLKPIIKKSSNSDDIVEDPHSAPAYSSLKSYVKLLYFIYQYTSGWYKNIVPLLNRGSLVIFDRYFDDMLVDTKRYRYGASVAIAKFARVFIPKPSLYFILYSSAETIYKRKQEVSFDELKRQIEEYKSLADNKRYFLIDVDNSPKNIVDEISAIMMDKLNG